MNYLLSALIGYLLGSIPTAYLVIKKAKRIDITEAGSNNVGAMNSYRVSKSKRLGLLVMLIDIGKGYLSVLATEYIFGEIFIYPAVASIFAVFAHCFNPWLGFKGGRGLATAAGISISIIPYVVVVWGLLWVMFFILKKNILFSNISSTIFSLIVFFNTMEIAVKYVKPTPESLYTLVLLITSVMIIIIIKHLEPLKELLFEKEIFRIKRDGKK